MARRSDLGRITAAFAVVLSLSAGPAEAAPELTLEQALRAARKGNRTVAAEQARLAQARINLDLAWTTLFPVVAAQGKYTRNNIEVTFPLSFGNGTGTGGPPRTITFQPKDQLDGVATITVPLVAPAAYAALAAVRTGVHAAEADHESALSGVLFSVAQAFYAAAIADEVVGARASNIEVARATVQLAETRFSVGTVTKADVDRAQLALVRAEQARREADFGREQAYRALTTLIQAQGEFIVAPGSAFATQADGTSLDTALRLRPEFRALELGARSVAAQSRAQAWRWSPTLSGFGNYRVFNYDNFAQQRHAWALGLTLDWVLFDGGVRDAQRRQANAQLRELESRTELLRDAIRDELANQRGLLDTKRHAQAAAERQVALAQETLDLVRTQYQAGSVAELDLLRAQDDLMAAKEALAQAHFEVALADVSLRRAAGEFPDDLGR